MPDITVSSKDSDEDSISLNSTLESEPQEEYPLDRILAERNNNGVTEYLVKWQNYPDERCTWEAQTNFRNDSTIPEWDHHKLRIKRGLEEPYNVAALEARVEAWLDATKKRKARRRAKRRRRGLSVDPTSPEDSSDSSNKSEEEDNELINNPPRAGYRTREARRRNLDMHTDEDSSLFVTSKSLRNRNRTRAPKSGYQKFESRRNSGSTDDQRKEDTPTGGERSSTEDSLMEDLRSRQPSKSHKGKQQLSKHHSEARATTAEKRKSNDPIPQSAATNSFPNKRQFPKPKELPSRGLMREASASKAKVPMMGKVGSDPARSGHKSTSSLAKPQVFGPAIFSNWNKGPGPRRGLPSLAGVLKKGNGKSKPFEKLSTRRKLSKAGRNEPAPNIERLVLVNPKMGLPPQKASLSSLPNALPSQSPFQMIQESIEKAKVTSPVKVSSEPLPEQPAERPTAKSSKTEDGDWPMDTDSLGPNLGETDARLVTELPNATKEERYQELQPTKPDYNPQGTQTRIQHVSSVENHQFVFASPVERLLPYTPHGLAQPMTLTQLKGDDGMKQGPGYAQPGMKHNVEDFSDIFGTINISPTHVKVGEVKFRGLLPPVKRLLLTIKIPPKTVDLWFRQICTAEEYKLYFHENMPLYYGAGHIVPWPQTIGPADTMADTLRMHDSAGLFISPDFSMIVYPTGSESWRFFDECFPLHSPSPALRFIMRTTIPQISSIYQPTLSMESTPLIMEGESGANALFRECFDIDFQKFLPQVNKNKSEQPNTFFLMYSPIAQEEHDVLVKFLTANNATIYSRQTPGAWDFFSNQVRAGVVLIHESFVPIHLIPSLSHVLLKSINFFSITLQPILPNPHLTRLFPHGGALLLTDSLILNHPQSALRILKWFHGYIVITKPAGTWKILMRPRIREWILSIIEDRSKAEGYIFVEIYTVIYKLLPLDLMDESDDFETPTEDAPVVCARELSNFDLDVGLGVKFEDTEGMATNDARLVEWFAGWARTKFEYIRRFHVVHGELDGGEETRRKWGRRWTHIMILKPESCFRMHSITEWENNEKRREEEKKTDRARRLSLNMSSK